MQMTIEFGDRQVDISACPFPPRAGDYAWFEGERWVVESVHWSRFDLPVPVIVIYCDPAPVSSTEGGGEQ